MAFVSRLSLRLILTSTFVAFALIPLVIIATATWRGANRSAEEKASSYAMTASTVADKIDRNLFERYGDVQAFGLNHALREREDWYKKGDGNPIVQAMNSYVDTYDIYYLTLLVDLDGKLIATNSKDQDGKSIDTDFLYDRNFSGASWLGDCKRGRFYESEDGSFTGTVVEHLYVDENARQVYGDEGLSLGYSAPVYDENGNVIAYWKNVTKFSLVEEIVLASYSELSEQGTPSAEITLLDENGNVIIDCDPTVTGRQEIVRDLSVIGKLNLAQKGVEPAVRVLAGESGSITKAWHFRKEINQVVGFSPHRGALGFPGMKWNVLVRVSCDEALASSNRVKTLAMVTIATTALAVLLLAMWFSRMISNVVKRAVVSMEAASNGDFSNNVSSQLSTDLARLSSSLNQMLSSLSKSEATDADFRSQIAAISRSQAVIEFNLDGTILTANENFLNTVGYTLEEIQGKHHRMFVDAEYERSVEYKQFWSSLREGRFYAGEFRRITKDGKDVWIQASYNPIFDKDGKPTKVVKYATDITSEKVSASYNQGQLNAIDKSQAVIQFELDGTIVDANDNFLKTVGYSLDEIQGKHHRMFVEEEYANSTEYAQFWADLSRGQYSSGEFLRVGKGGKEIWIQASYNPILDLKGKPCKVVKFASEITDQVTAREEAVKLRGVVEDSRSATMMVDRDLVVTYVNEATKKLLHENRETFRSVWPSFDPNAIIGTCIDQFHKDPQYQRNILSNPNNLPYQADIQIGEFTFSLNVSATYNAAGDYIGNTLVWADVTEKRNLEARNADYTGQIQAIAKSQAVIEFDLEGNIVDANQNFLDVMGYRLDEIVGKHHRVFVEPDYARGADYAEFWKKLAQGEYVAGDFMRLAKDGSEVWIQASYNPILDPDGKPMKVVKYASDITATKQMEVRIRETQELEQQEAERQQHKVAELLEVVNQVAGGNLAVTIPELGDDAIGQVASGVRTAVDSIRSALVQVEEVATTVSSSAKEMASASDQISSGALQQASSLEETAASLEEITSAVKQNTDNSQQAQQLSMSSREVAESGGNVVGNAVEAMTAINSASKKIAEIITTIDEIAFQTNLLALNAAVEAARAGEQGRGFAVVASEVRNLAQRSAGAAKEIKNLIQDSVAKVENGTELVNRSGETLQEIVNSVKRVADIVTEISAASTEQLTGIEQVNGAVSQMDRVTQTNAAQTEEMTGNAQSLRSHADNLQSLVGTFQLGESQSMMRSTPSTSRPAPTTTNNSADVVVASPKSEAVHELDLVGVGADSDFEEF